MGGTESTAKDVIAGVEICDDMPLWALLIFEYSEWSDRFNLMGLTRRWKRNTDENHFSRFMCNRLSIEHGVYVPLVLPTAETWKNMFGDLYKIRNIWITRDDQPSSAEIGERFKISVFARFRPPALVTTVEEEGDHEEKHRPVEVTLPLYQRLAMIKMSHNLKSNKEALKVLTSEGGWFQAKWTELEDKENNEKSNNTIATATTGKGSAFYSTQKVPHITVKKQEEKMVAAVQRVDPVSGRVIMIAPDVGLREFSFNGVLPIDSSQRYMYDSVMRRLVTDFINGFNATAIVYGQTGSGKTYSMFGRDEASIYGRDHEGKGIVPRACEEIFQAIEQRREVNGIHTVMAVSYVEIYGDHVSDLLQYGSRCGHSQVSSQRYVLNGAAEKTVTSMDEVAELLKQGENQKRRAATAMNERSSRAHSLFIITLKQSKLDGSTDVTLTSRLFLADLGGSEQNKKSKVEAGAERLGLQDHFSLGFELGAHMREAVYINLGLLALKKCIESLNNRSAYTPYQDSKLTMLLSAGLGGNSKTSIMICNNMDPTHASETVATLRFGERCALIENEARNNATMLAAVLADIDAQIEALEVEILKKERWELREEKRVDELAEENTFEAAAGGFELKKVAELVGAEKERQALEQLLIRRARFTGSKPLDDEGEQGEKTRKVVGFGKKASLYGVGSEFDAAVEADTDNTRFELGLQDVSNLPAVVRAKGTTNWATAGDLTQDAEVLARKAAKVKRNRLAYSGISA